MYLGLCAGCSTLGSFLLLLLLLKQATSLVHILVPLHSPGWTLRSQARGLARQTVLKSLSHHSLLILSDWYRPPFSSLVRVLIFLGWGCHRQHQ